MVDADVVLAILEVLPFAVVDGGWGVDALARRVTRPHRDLDLVVPVAELRAALDSLRGLGFELRVDERPARMVVARDDGAEVDLHLVEPTPAGMAQRLPGGTRFTYVFDGATGSIGDREVACLPADVQLLVHAGYEPSDTDRADVALVAQIGHLSVPPPYAPSLRRGEPVDVREATGADVAAAGIVRLRSWRAAYPGLMPQGVIDSLDLGTTWATWSAGVARPASADNRLFVAGRPGEVHAYAWTGPSEVRAVYADPEAWGTAAGHAVFTAACAFLRGRGHDDLHLWMLRGNRRAARFYERAGWHTDGEQKTTTTPAGSFVEVRYRAVAS